MKILGLSSNYHDASAALVVDGKVQFAAAEERFTRRKHDPSFPSRAVRACLKSAGISAEEVDLVVYHEDPHNKLSRSLATSLARWPLSLHSFLLSAKDATTSGLKIHFDISHQLGIDARKVVFAPHHMSHASLAFLTSPFEEAAVMTIDAVGEWISSAIFRASRRGGELRIEPLHVSSFPHSLGLFYSSVTSYLGFRVNDGECSTMALAAFGKPRFLEEMRKIVRIKPDGDHELDLSYLDFRSDTQLPVSEKFLAAFGPNRSYKSRLPFDAMGGPGGAPDGEAQRFADVAASAQAVLEEAVLAYARKTQKLTGLRDLCYAGGVSLNCVANGKLEASGIFDSVFVPVDPGDGGAALGAALYVSALKGDVAGRDSAHPYHGTAAEPSELRSMVPLINAAEWASFAPLSTPGVRGLKWLDLSATELPEVVAGKIRQGLIVGWCQGRFEQGPRALGARSLLIRADDPALARKLSTRVKRREAFRPYALSMTEREAGRSLTISAVPHCARWMQTSVNVKEERQAALRAGLHVDGSTRVQILREAENPAYHRLLEAYGRLSGAEAFVNTSFNEAGAPLVASHLDALLMFARTEMDVLVIENVMIEKEVAG